MKQLPTLNIGHHKQQSTQGLKIEFTSGRPGNTLEKAYLHRHNFYMATLILEGYGDHIVDFEKYEVKPNRLFFLLPGQVHFLKTDDSAEYYTIQFTSDFFTSQSNQIFPFQNQYILDISNENIEELCHIFKHMLKEKVKGGNNIVLTNYLNILLEKIKIEINSQAAINKSNPVINRFKNLIEENFKENQSVRYYAEKLHISPNYLNIVSKRETGISASLHIKNRIMLEAKRLVIHSDFSVSQIAYELNFCDTSYFIKKFREVTRLTPGDFKTNYYKMLYT